MFISSLYFCLFCIIFIWQFLQNKNKNLLIFFVFSILLFINGLGQISNLSCHARTLSVVCGLFVYFVSLSFQCCIYVAWFWFSLCFPCVFSPPVFMCSSSHLPCITLVSPALLLVSSPAYQLPACPCVVPPVPCCLISSVCI